MGEIYFHSALKKLFYNTAFNTIETRTIENQFKFLNFDEEVKIVSLFIKLYNNLIDENSLFACIPCNNDLGFVDRAFLSAVP